MSNDSESTRRLVVCTALSSLAICLSTLSAIGAIKFHLSLLGQDMVRVANFELTLLAPIITLAYSLMVILSISSPNASPESSKTTSVHASRRGNIFGMLAVVLMFGTVVYIARNMNSIGTLIGYTAIFSALYIILVLFSYMCCIAAAICSIVVYLKINAVLNGGSISIPALNKRDRAAHRWTTASFVSILLISFYYLIGTILFLRQHEGVTVSLSAVYSIVYPLCIAGLQVILNSDRAKKCARCIERLKQVEQ